MQALTYRHTSTLAHTNTHHYTHRSTHACIDCIVATTVHWLHQLILHLYDENDTLKHQVAELTTWYNSLTSQVYTVSLLLSKLEAAAAAHLLETHRKIRRDWHEQANATIRTSHSRESPTHSYGCARAGCNWRNKMVTLQAHVLHLKRKQRENIR